MTWTRLRLWAEMHYDAEKVRIATTNRVGSATVHPDLYAYVEQVRASEAWSERALIEEARDTAPHVMQWVKETHGLGPKTMARLLGVLGHPVHAQPYHWKGVGKKRVVVADEPFDRTLRQLWSYCGVGDPERRPRPGMSSDEYHAMGNRRCRTRLYVISVACMKTPTSPYRSVFEFERDRIRTLHPEYTKGRVHNAALRKIGKEVLRDLYNVAKHDSPTVHGNPDSRFLYGGGGPPSEGAPGGVFLAETVEEAMRILEDSP